MDQAGAIRLAADARELWHAGSLDAAEARYRASLALADPRHHRTPDLHAEYAGLLTALYRLEDAGRQYERALHLELQHDPDESSAPVVAARYVLGEHYLRAGDADSARRVVAPSLEAAQKPLAWIVEADALRLSGATEEARTAAERAMALAASPEQRERIRSRFADLLPASEAG